ncbi:MAG: AMP-binding protein [Bacteroidales bacterium]|nr:AMP-binding protein [Bacteroidales bacterium]
MQENLVRYFEESIRNNWDKQAFSDYKGVGYTYKEIAEKIILAHHFFELSGIKKGDKVALIGKNSSNWAISFIATVCYGAVIVPILPDFKPRDVHHIVNHSDSVFLFTGEQIIDTLSPEEMPNIKTIVSISDFSVKHSATGNHKFPETGSLPEGLQKKISPENFVFPEVENENLALISYTSGTTGHSKGVMLLLNSLSANVRFARNNMPLKSGDKIVSFLPLAHAYGLAFEFLFPFSLGCHITFLTKTPSPQIITQAFAEIRPRLILSVPLVIEKIYKKKLLPTIEKPSIKILLHTPGLKHVIHKSIKKKLLAVFGGNFHEVVIGGAAFNADAERFFRKIKFPFTVGYGMTECGPLISYTSWQNTELQASGKLVDTLEVQIDSDDPQNIAGEILVRGDNVMVGYYKNEEATRAAIDSNGWLHTGDLGVIDNQGNIYIRGRSKSMLLGPSGQNIYPEEIESVLNNMHGVLESLVIEENGKLVAIIVPDKETTEAEGIDSEKLNHIMKHNLKELNHHVPAYMQVSKYELRDEEFEKTPKRSIKRFLYTKSSPD